MSLVITDANFNELVLGADKPVLVDFWADWCGSSNMVGPVVEAIYREYAGKAIVGKLDVETNPDAVKRYGVCNIPALLFFKDGQIVDKQIGAVPKSQLAEKLDKHLG